MATFPFPYPYRSVPIHREMAAERMAASLIFPDNPPSVYPNQLWNVLIYRWWKTETSVGECHVSYYKITIVMAASRSALTERLEAVKRSCSLE